MTPRHLSTACAVSIAIALAMILADRGVIAQGLACTVSTTPVSFGNYNVFNSSPATATGDVAIRCLVNLFVRVDISAGSGASFSPRLMKSGSNSLQYNLYKDSGYGTVWGDGTGGSAYFSELLEALGTQHIPVYGRVPARQDAAAGSYTDTVTATIVF